MSHFSHPMQLSKDYTLITKTPIIEEKQNAPLQVRTVKERREYAVEIGHSHTFFLIGRNKNTKRVRIVEILGKGDMREGYLKLQSIFKETEIAVYKVFEDLTRNREKQEFSKWLNRDKSFISSTQEGIKKSGGIDSYTKMKMCRVLVKSYEVFKSGV